jgi:hypothetical protein
MKQANIEISRATTITVINGATRPDGDAIVLHVYRDASKSLGICGFTTFDLLMRTREPEVVHVPLGTPVGFAFAQAFKTGARLGLHYLIINDPGGLFPPEKRPRVA